MKATFAVTLCVLLLLVSACSQKVNDPADVQAIKKSIEAYPAAANAADANAIAALMTDNATYAVNHVPIAVGKEAILSLYQALFSQFSMGFSISVEDVRVVGDLAMARGT